MNDLEPFSAEWAIKPQYSFGGYVSTDARVIPNPHNSASEKMGKALVAVPDWLTAASIFFFHCLDLSLLGDVHNPMNPN